ncbi:COR domain-containing protein [Aquimarina sp. 2201CG14-23]|uniref:COR domain-containing protein n=1 Tax=Aquimarina mycalae TaxID=3040073 RepID=UPI0024781E7D|nr:COR domain-containing protein [Aquimarina sp. 2201CG14-23]MDH7444695.1 COR domain-containing protein [Aquimarina sp. 2201CG14-23]
MTTSNIKIAIERINQVKENRLRYLNLSGLSLTEIPIDISDMFYLLDIDLSHNQLLNFPDSITELDNLQFLDISNNSIKDVHFKLGKYYSLKEINISSNDFNFIPKELFFLNDDTKIIFDDNPFLKGLPPELESQDNLLYINYYVDALKKTNNRKRLFETKLLLVGKGNVGKTTLMKTLKNPSNEIKIGNEKPTHGINIETMNHPMYFPAKLPYYSLEDYENIYFIGYEEDIDVEFYQNGEPMEKTIMVETHTHISEYLKSGDFDDHLIELRVSEEPYHIDNSAFFEKDIRINLWDFGGQELLYGTHQFFLTQRSVYLFVWDSRPDNEEESFDYWLNVIQRLSNDSPIIIVMNKLDNGIKNIDEVSYKERFKNIIGFYRVSCVSKEGIKDLIDKITNTIVELPHIADEVPKSWDDIRKKLKELNKDFITYQEFETICNLNNKWYTTFLSSYLNDLGDIVHFKDDFALKDLVITNPDWLTKAIYELIHSLEIQKNDGLFNADDLSKLLDETKYPSVNYHKILLLMEKFEICFKVIGSNNLYIIPTLLQAMPPDSINKSQFEIPESLKYEIYYEFMPSGLIERLICRLKDFLKGNHFWKYGAVFKNELSEALVILNKPKKTIKLYVTGNVKSTLYSLITQEIKRIHKF